MDPIIETPPAETTAPPTGIDLIPEEIRKDSSISPFKNVGDLAKSYIETKKLVGTIEKPPADPKEYKFSLPENLHPSIKPTDEVNKAFAERFHKMGLSQAKADAVYKEFYQFQSEQITAKMKEIEATRQKNETALKQEWGADYDKNYNNIVRAISKAGGTEADATIKEVAVALKSTPLALKALGKIVNLISEDSINALGGGNSPTGPQGEEKEFQDLAESFKDPKSAINDSKNPGHNAAKARWAILAGKFDLKR